MRHQNREGVIMFKSLPRPLFFSLLLASSFVLTGCTKHGDEKVLYASETQNITEHSDAQTGPNDTYATLRDLGLADDETPPRMMPEMNEDLRRVRNYPEQPPTIPHKIEAYQIDKKHNQCMDCHARANVGVSQAPMVSITHYMDRSGQFLASISARRYFCTQCHVAQLDVKPLVENGFVDVDTVVAQLEEHKSKDEGRH